MVGEGKTRLSNHLKVFINRFKVTCEPAHCLKKKQKKLIHNKIQVTNKAIKIQITNKNPLSLLLSGGAYVNKMTHQSSFK